MAAVYRAPMRARDRDLAPGLGAERGVEAGVVGIGDTPGEKGDRMLRRFKALPDGAYVWTRLPDRSYRVGRIAGPWRYDDSAAAGEVGIPHVRDARWLAGTATPSGAAREPRSTRGSAPRRTPPRRR